MVIAILAILKSGAAYLPLDPAYPRDRLDFMRADADAEGRGPVPVQSLLPGETAPLSERLSSKCLSMPGPG